MRRPTVSEIAKEIDLLPPLLQRRVLAFVRALVASTPKGTPGKALLAFAGGVDPTEAEIMARAIEEGCRRVDKDGW